MFTDFEGFTINESDDIVDAIGKIKGPTSIYRKVLLKESVQSIEKALLTVPAASKATNRANPALEMKELPMKEYNTNVSLDEYSHIEPSKPPKKYMIRDASFALDHLPPYQLINSIVTQTAGGKGRTQ